jgi:PiT family inorganic phosphate transporter
LILAALLIAGALFVAYANGANDNFKGVATLYGSGTVGYKGALAWATVTTFAGSLCSVLLAEKLVRIFSAKGLVPESVAGTPEFLAAVALGAALTVFLATLLGFPVSTTHALTGALVGAGVMTVGSSVNFSLLGKTFFLPLLASPLLAIVGGGLSYPSLRWVRARTGLHDQSCLCLGDVGSLSVSTQSGSVERSTEAPVVHLTTGTAPQCAQSYPSKFLSIKAQSLLDAGHFLSAGAVSFARGLNDAPKIVGLMFVLEALSVRTSLFLVASVMAVGGLLHARKVGETVAHRITRMNHAQGFVANLVTSCLVLTASGSGLPVSTTHVSCGSLFGIGLITGQANVGVIRQVVASWVLTLPLAAVLAGVASLVLS